jgi:SEC-C motif-containing protein
MSAHKIGRNESCPCGSGKKYKRCCSEKDERERHEQAAAEARSKADTATPALNPAQLAAMDAAASIGDVRRINEIVQDGVAVLRHRDPERLAHDERHTAYHEAGHALLITIFFGDLQSVTVVARYESVEDYHNGELSSGCRRLVPDVTGVEQQFAYVAVLLAGKIAGDFFCTCDMHVGGECDADQEAVNEYLSPETKAEALSHITPATVTVLDRHRPQLDAIVEALIERETLSGDDVMEVMRASGWNPETDCDPEQFYNEVLGITADIPPGPTATQGGVAA